MVTAGETAADEEGTVVVEEVTETWTVVVTDHVIAVAVGVDLESVAGTIAKDLPGETAEDAGVQIVTAALPDARQEDHHLVTPLERGQNGDHQSKMTINLRKSQEGAGGPLKIIKMRLKKTVGVAQINLPKIAAGKGHLKLLRVAVPQFMTRKTEGGEGQTTLNRQMAGETLMTPNLPTKQVAKGRQLHLQNLQSLSMSKISRLFKMTGGERQRPQQKNCPKKRTPMHRMGQCLWLPKRN